MVISLAFLLLTLVGPVLLVVLLVRRSTRQGAGPGDGRAVRRFFQYLLLYGLLIVATVGVADLISFLVDAPVLAGDSGVARTLTFTLVGLPMFLGAAAWSRKRLRQDPEESRSFGWTLYVTAASLTTLVVAMTLGIELLSILLRGDGLVAAALMRLVVWSAVCAAHWVVGARLLAPPQRQWVLVLWSLIGLGTTLGALVWLLGAVVDAALPRSRAVLVGADPGDLADAAAPLVVGAVVWVVAWWRGFRGAERTLLWLAYVLPVGVGGSLVMALVGASLALHSVLVWLLGEPTRVGASEHFDGTTTAGAALVVGAVSWWYHRGVLAAAGDRRTEISRVYEYLMAGIALVSSAAGVALVVVVAVEALAPPADIEFGTSVVNALLGAATLLLVGGPLWWVYWSRIGRAAVADPDAELGSPTRRTYLFLLFGVGGVIAVVAVLVLAFLSIQAALDTRERLGLAYQLRIPLALLLAAGAISGYHWLIYREDRRRSPAVPGPQAPRYVLLVGAASATVAEAVSRETGARVDLWVRDDATAPWVLGDVLAAVRGATSESVAVLAGPAGAQLVGIHRMGAVPLTG